MANPKEFLKYLSNQIPLGWINHRGIWPNAPCSMQYLHRKWTQGYKLVLPKLEMGSINMQWEGNVSNLYLDRK